MFNSVFMLFNSFDRLEITGRLSHAKASGDGKYFKLHVNATILNICTVWFIYFVISYVIKI